MTRHDCRDHPPCDEARQKLIPFIPTLVGTAGDKEADRRRVYLAVDWSVRRLAPRWLRKAGLEEEADRVAALPEITTATQARAAEKVVRAARDKAYEVRRERWAKLPAYAAAYSSLSAVPGTETEPENETSSSTAVGRDVR